MIVVPRQWQTIRRALTVIVPVAVLACAVAAGAHGLPLLHHVAVMKPHTGKWW